MEWNLKTLFESLNSRLENELHVARASIQHPGSKGDASENIWINWFKTYLPFRYQVTKGHVMDSLGNASQQIDIIIFDRHFTPPLFQHAEQKVIPAESVYAVFEVKQQMGSEEIKYAQEKAASVRKLHRTNMPTKQQGKKNPVEASELLEIQAGLLSLDGNINDTITKALNTNQDKNACLQLGCAASNGYFEKVDGEYKVFKQKPSSAFLFALVRTLQALGTVPSIDMREYEKWNQ